MTGEREAPYTIGWANIYSIPTWMKQTQGTIEDVFDQLKEQGLTDEFVITDAEGNANTQITQIQSMIDADVDGIVVIAGSSTALDRVIAQACEKGIAVINVDSLVEHRRDHRQDQHRLRTCGASSPPNGWSSSWAARVKIIIMNGPAGVSVSEDRRAGATPVLEANPGIEVLTETNTPYNAAPAQEAMTSLLFQYPEIDGILSFGGALTAGAILAMDRQGRDVPPSSGENYRQFLEMWNEKGFPGWATMQPNWLGGLGVYAAVKALEGEDIPAFVEVPLPIITNENLDEYLARAEDFPADGYIYSPYDLALFDEILGLK